MEFYSRTPEETRRIKEDRDEKSHRRRRTGRLILLFDIVLVVIIMFYLYEKKLNNKNVQPKISSSKSLVFEYRNVQIESYCKGSYTCQTSLSQSKKNAKITTDLNTWKAFEFILTKSDAKDEIFSAHIPLVKLGDKLKRSKNLTFSYEFPIEIKEQNRVYIRLIDSKNKERIKFKIFP